MGGDRCIVDRLFPTAKSSVYRGGPLVGYNAQNEIPLCNFHAAAVRSRRRDFLRGYDWLGKSRRSSCISTDFAFHVVGQPALAAVCFFGVRGWAESADGTNGSCIRNRGGSRCRNFVLDRKLFLTQSRDKWQPKSELRSFHFDLHGEQFNFTVAALCWATEVQMPASKRNICRPFATPIKCSIPPPHCCGIITG